MDKRMDVWEELSRYRQVKALPDGSTVVLRPLAVDDRAELIDLFARASREDLAFFRDDAADPSVVGSWVDHLTLSRVFPLVAVVDGLIVGDATLHFRERYHRHLAWVRIFLDRAYRRRGIGTLMLSGLVDVARRVGLQQLYVEAVSTQTRVIKALSDLGFRPEVTLQDYFITAEDDLLDMIVMKLQVTSPPSEF